MPTTDRPVRLLGSIVALVETILAALVIFGVPLPPSRDAAILGVLVAAGPVVTQLLIRRDAWSPVAHKAQLQLTRHASSTGG